MGKRLHVAKTYQVEYAGGKEYFNYKIEEFHDLMKSLGIDCYPDDPFSEDMEISKCKWRKGVKKLKNLSTLNAQEQEEITNAVAALDVTVEQLVTIMEEFEAASDPDNCVMYLSFF